MMKKLKKMCSIILVAFMLFQNIGTSLVWAVDSVRTVDLPVMEYNSVSDLSDISSERLVIDVMSHPEIPSDEQSSTDTETTDTEDIYHHDHIDDISVTESYTFDEMAGSDVRDERDSRDEIEPTR